MSTLLSRNADYSLKIKSHAQPLYIAAMKGHVKVVTMLMKARADINATPLHKTTPLQIAIRNGFTDPTEAGKGGLPNPMDTSHRQHSQCYLGATLGYPWILVWIVYSCTYKYTHNLIWQDIKGAGCTNKIPLPWLPWNSESKPRFRVQNIRLLRVGYLCSWFCLKVADRLLDAGASVNQADQFDKTCLDEAMKKARR